VRIVGDGKLGTKRKKRKKKESKKGKSNKPTTQEMQNGREHEEGSLCHSFGPVPPLGYTL
jgi:hypothetical protein